MKQRKPIFLAVMAASLVASAAATAQSGYWFGKGGDVVRSGAGDCVHTKGWTPEQAIVGCDGKVAEPEAAPPPPPPPPAMAPMTGTVNFGFDSADLDDTATAAINDMLQQAGGAGQVAGAKLVGHTDRVGTEEYNLELSLRRAEAVNQALVDAGVNPQSIEMTGKGEMEPLVDCEGKFGNAALECLAPNRRVDIELSKP